MLKFICLLQVISTIAGTGITGFSGDLGSARDARIWHPEGMALDSSGNLLFADVTNNRIRKITLSTGIITTFTGIGTFSYTGDGGLAKFAGFNSPEGLCFDAYGNLYIADTDNDCIRKIDRASGVVSTIAGGGVAGIRDGYPARTARLNNPTGVAVDSAGNVYIADWGNNRIRIVSADSECTIHTLAGTGTAGYSGDGGRAFDAQLNSPFGIALDAHNNVYIADAGNNCIRKIDAGSGIITTVIKKINNPTCIALADSANIYVAEQGSNRILEINTLDATFIVVAGKSGHGDYSGDDGDPFAAELWSPTGMVVDRFGNIYFSDRNNNRIRKIVR